MSTLKWLKFLGSNKVSPSVVWWQNSVEQQTSENNSLTFGGLNIHFYSSLPYHVTISEYPSENKSNLLVGMRGSVTIHCLV